MYSITGQEVALPGNPIGLSQNGVLNVSGVPAGSYILRLQVHDGESRNFLILVGGR